MLARFILFSWIIGYSTGAAGFLPDNSLRIHNRSQSESRLDKADFEAINQSILTIYQPILKKFKAKLKINLIWEDDRVNALAKRQFRTWGIDIYGGFARLPMMTADGYALVVCHEIGHHLGGYPIQTGIFSNGWTALEGQSDYYATLSCAKNLWGNETEANAVFRYSVSSAAQDLCDQFWENQDDQYLCYRTLQASETLGHIASVLYDYPVPDLKTPDSERATFTAVGHPSAQCRLDTWVAGALCQVPWDNTVIPGEGKRMQDAEVHAAKYSCTRRNGDPEITTRPRCWFKPFESSP